MSDEKTRSDLVVEHEAYVAYLIARGSGVYPRLKDGVEATLLERYAVALGVHHHQRGVRPVSFRKLLRLASGACEGSCGWDALHRDLGPSPPDPGSTDP